MQKVDSWPLWQNISLEMRVFLVLSGLRLLFLKVCFSSWSPHSEGRLLRCWLIPCDPRYHCWKLWIDWEDIFTAPLSCGIFCLISCWLIFRSIGIPLLTFGHWLASMFILVHSLLIIPLGRVYFYSIDGIGLTLPCKRVHDFFLFFSFIFVSSLGAGTLSELILITYRNHYYFCWVVAENCCRSSGRMMKRC